MNELGFRYGSAPLPLPIECNGVIGQPHDISEYTNRCGRCGKDSMEIVRDGFREWEETYDTKTGEIISRRIIRWGETHPTTAPAVNSGATSGE